MESERRLAFQVEEASSELEKAESKLTLLERGWERNGQEKGSIADNVGPRLPWSFKWLTGTFGE